MPFEHAHPALARALAARGYSDPTEVQAAVLAAPADRDLLVSARTGSGKTVAFGLALAATLLGEAARFERPGAPLALVVAPTRELALQVQRELAWLFAEAGGVVVPCVGGMDPRREGRALVDGVHLVVGTPGRLCDHLERGPLDLSRVRAVVLDEADEMLDMGFRDELERLLDATPAERRTLLFSATVPSGIAALAQRYQKDAARVAATDAGEPHADIAYLAVPVAPAEREHVVVNLLRHYDARAALVFCTTREAVNRLHANLVERGFTAVALSGELGQTERNRAIQALRDGRARVCVASDVASRGLDLPDVGLVIHADLPLDGTVLLHRSGRTGRAGRKGAAVVLVPFPRVRQAHRLFAEARVTPTWGPPPDPEAIRIQDDERLLTEVAELLEPVAEEDRAIAQRLLEAHAAEDLVAALVRARRHLLPAPEEVPASLGWRERPSMERTRRPATPPEAVEGVWFRLNTGRAENADPRWILPLVCRRGRVGREEIGQIRILAHETHVEVSPRVATHFAMAVRRPDRAEPWVRIVPLRR